MSYLAPRHFPSQPEWNATMRAPAGTPITRENVDAMLDAHRIEVAAFNGKWYTIRRNGATRRWKRDPRRIYIPFKVGFRNHGNITESDFFLIDGLEQLNPTVFRIV